MRKKKQLALPEEMEGNLNLTPLIDVVFVVLILFILVCPMLEYEKVQLCQGAASAPATNTLVASPLAIHVHHDNSIWVNKQLIQKEQLKTFLKALHTKNPSLVPQLYHDKKAFFETYQLVKNAVEEAGYPQLDLILESAK